MSCHPERPRGPALVALALIGVAGAGLLTGCTSPAPIEAPTTTATAGGPATAEPQNASPTPPPALVPAGTAQDNLAFFSAVTAQIWATEASGSGRAYIDALSAAGFDRAAMQVTYDESTVGNQAESIQFSVRWGDECLIGQVGPATGSPVTVVVPVLSEGNCLIGSTRPIDW